MSNWLNKQQLAEKLGVHVKTAERMMMEMQPVPISGKVRKRYRVSEENVERWMLKHMIGSSAPVSSIGTGSKKKLQRRG